MDAASIMTPDVVTVGPDASVEEIAKTMLNRHISAVPVVDGGNKILGIVSEGDLMRRPETGTEPRHSWWLDLVSSGADRAGEYLKSHGLTAADVMTKEVVTVEPATPAGDVAEKLERRHIKRVPVVDNGRLVGIVSRANILRALASHKKKMPSGASADDETIRTRVLQAIAAAKLDAEPMVNPIVSDGVVHLWGSAESEQERDAVRVAAESAEGVKSVESHIGLLQGMTRAVLWAE